jgi:hypothetical protein
MPRRPFDKSPDVRPRLVAMNGAGRTTADRLRSNEKLKVGSASSWRRSSFIYGLAACIGEPPSARVTTPDRRSEPANG